MKLALIGAAAQRGLALAEPPHLLLVVRAGARTAKTSPGTELVQYVEVSDAELGLNVFASSIGGYGHSVWGCGAAGLDCAASAASAASAACGCPFEAYRYKARRGLLATGPRDRKEQEEATDERPGDAGDMHRDDAL
jgi:hypothetical protein